MITFLISHDEALEGGKKQLVIYLVQATPRLSEDKVKQCVDPKLKDDYPPKAVAKVRNAAVGHGDFSCAGNGSMPA